MRPTLKPAYRFREVRGEKFHGDPCIHGHGTLRYRSSGGCVVCIQQAAEAKRAAFKCNGKTFNPRKHVTRPNSRYWLRWLLHELRLHCPSVPFSREQ